MGGQELQSARRKKTDDKKFTPVGTISSGLVLINSTATQPVVGFINTMTGTITVIGAIQ